MEINQILSTFVSWEMGGIIFKLMAILLSMFFVLYSFIIARQVKIMDQTLKDRFNPFILTVCSLQTIVAMVLLILSILFA